MSVNQQMPQVVDNLGQQLCSIFENVPEPLRPSECIKDQEETTTQGNNGNKPPNKPPNGKAESLTTTVFAFYFLLTLTTINLAFDFLN